MVENFILSKIFCPKFSCIKSSMPDIPKFSNHQKLVCIKFYVKNFPVSQVDQPVKLERLNEFRLIFNKLKFNYMSVVLSFPT